ncbi:MAG: hypothetical protein IPG58_02180 [Acidobacteria bacterium]|nr:hypothetical protein [Acidobacteriota bacterium]
MNKVSRSILFATIVGTTSLIAFAQAPISKPLATPPPAANTAEIISRDRDLVETPITVKTPEKVVEKPVATPGVGELMERIKRLEAGQTSTYDEKQKRLLLNLDILTRAEQRSESLRKQLFEMIEKENTVRSRLDQLEFESRPEVIERALQLNGSMKPEDVRDNRRKSLNAEKANLNSLLTEIQSSRASLNLNFMKAEQMVELLRVKLEKDITDSFLKDEPDLRDPAS